MGLFDNFMKKYFNIEPTTPIQQQVQQPFVTQQDIAEVQPIIEEDNYYSFPVAGISFHDKELKKIIKNNLDQGKLEKFKGLSNRDIIDFGYELDIYETQLLDGVTLEKYLFNGKNAIKVLIDDTTGNYLEIGSVPNNHLNAILEILNRQITKLEYEITGGVRKTPTLNDNGRDIIDTQNLNYGMVIHIYYK